jgi:hypothetical protein
MRLSDPEYLRGITTPVPGEDISLVNWPADAWGNPYVFYQVVADPDLATSANPKGLRLIKTPAESGDYFTAIVSYGANRVPGRSDTAKFTNDQLAQILQTEGLYLKGDVVSGGPAEYTLKSIHAASPAALDANFNARLFYTLEGKLIDPNAIGIRDSGSDDIFIPF